MTEHMVAKQPERTLHAVESQLLALIEANGVIDLLKIISNVCHVQRGDAECRVDEELWRYRAQTMKNVMDWIGDEQND